MVEYAGDQNVISDIIIKIRYNQEISRRLDTKHKWYDRSGQRYHKGKWTFEHNGRIVGNRVSRTAQITRIYSGMGQKSVDLGGLEQNQNKKTRNR